MIDFSFVEGQNLKEALVDLPRKLESDKLNLDDFSDHCSKELVSILKQMMQYNPDKRPGCKELL